jgi:gonadotropin-releasing hormone receptor
MVVSAIGNITVLSILLRRKQRNPSRLDIMLTHLAIADLLVKNTIYAIEIVLMTCKIKSPLSRRLHFF